LGAQEERVGIPGLHKLDAYTHLAAIKCNKNIDYKALRGAVLLACDNDEIMVMICLFYMHSPSGNTFTYYK